MHALVGMAVADVHAVVRELAALDVEISGDGGCAAAATASDTDATRDGNIAAEIALRAFDGEVRGLQCGAIGRNGQQKRPVFELDRTGNVKHQRTIAAAVFPVIGGAVVVALYVCGTAVLRYGSATRPGKTMACARSPPGASSTHSSLIAGTRQWRA